MPRGGSRQGTPGKKYKNRLDLQTGARKLPVQAPSGLPGYGDRKQLEDMQRAVPLQSRPQVGQPQGPPQGGAPPLFPNGLPPDVQAEVSQDLLRPTEHPDEPVTSGMAFGPGPGPDVPQGPVDAGVNLDIRALYQAYPNEDLRELLEDVDQGVTF